MSAEVESAPVQTENAVETKESPEAPVEAGKLLAQGKRNLVCGEIPTAVNQLQEACGLLAASYGDTAFECGESYFYYGQALLELARMETGVLGNALQGVPEEDTEDDAEPNEQFEKAENLTGEELEKIRDDVYDAMSESDPAKSQAKKDDEPKVNGDGNTEGDKPEDATMETEEENKENVEKKEKVDVGGKKPLENKSEENKNEKNKLTEKADELIKKDEKILTDKKSDAEKLTNGEAGKDAEVLKEKNESAKENGTKIDTETKDGKSESNEIKKEDKDDEVEKLENGTEEMEVGEESKEESKEGEGDDAEGDEEEEGEEEGTAEEGEETDPGEGPSSGANEEDPDDISNLQLSWEVLEVAKNIYLKQDSKEMKLKAAQAFLKLGEVSLETERYDQAISDITDCLKIQQELLPEDDRLLAETQYQLGLAFSFNKKFDEAIDSLRAAVKVIEERMGKLKKVVIEGKTEEKEEKTEEKEEKTEEKAEKKTEEKAEKKTEEKAEEKTEEKAEEKTEEKAEEKTDKPEKKTEGDKATEKTAEEQKEKTDGQKESKDIPEDPVKAAQKEIDELSEILPEIHSKIEDVVEERKNMDMLKTMAKEEFTSQMESETETIGTQPQTSESGAKASDISHLIRKKRKPESDVEEEAEKKKSKQENGSGDATPTTNGVHEEDKTKEPAVKDVPMVTDDKAEAVST